MKSSAWLRTGLSSVFVLLMLASAHLLMVMFNRAELLFAHPDVSAGVEARMFADRPLLEELQRALSRAPDEASRAVYQRAIAEVEATGGLRLRTLPVTQFMALTAVGLSLLGVLLIWLTSRLKGDAAQTILGIFGGNLLWTGGVEYGLTIAARSLGIGKAVAVVDGQLVATYGEYVLLKHSWGAFALVMAYLLFLESSRCTIFLWWRERIPTMRGALATGRVDNFGPRTAFQYASTVWGFYVLLLWAYDEAVFGVHGFFTSAVLVLTLAGSLFCTWRLHQRTGWGPAIRYAIGAMIVAWTPLEIAGKWGLFREPWLLLNPASLLVFFGGLALGTWWLWRAQRRPLPTIADDPAAA